MGISERLFALMNEKGISIRELSRRTGITASTISDWNTKKTNPSADKLMAICEALDISYLQAKKKNKLNMTTHYLLMR